MYIELKLYLAVSYLSIEFLFNDLEGTDSRGVSENILDI